MARLILGKTLRRHYDRSPFLRHCAWLLEAALVGGFWGVCALLPVARASALGRRVMAVLGPRSRKHHKVLSNMRLMFPGRSAQEQAAIAREMWGNFGAVFAEYPHLGRTLHRETAERVEIQGQAHLEGCLGRQRPVVFVTAHLMNWEIPGSTIVFSGLPLVVVFSPLQNPYLDRMLQRYRNVEGIRLIRKADSFRPLYRELAAGNAVIILPDQRVDGARPVPFFGHDAPTTDSPARLALRFDCDLVPVRVERLAGVRFRVTFHPPLRPNDEKVPVQDQALDMTRQLNALFESWIRERPQDWLCTKRRWPKEAYGDADLENS